MYTSLYDCQQTIQCVSIHLCLHGHFWGICNLITVDNNKKAGRQFCTVRRTSRHGDRFCHVNRLHIVTALHSKMKKCNSSTNKMQRPGGNDDSLNRAIRRDYSSVRMGQQNLTNKIGDFKHSTVFLPALESPRKCQASIYIIKEIYYSVQ